MGNLRIIWQGLDNGLTTKIVCFIRILNWAIHANFKYFCCLKFVNH